MYTQLDTEAREVRILRLLPSEIPKDIVEAELVITNLKGIQPYTAVSYAWGDPTATESIKLSGETVPVTKTLAYILKSMRRNIVRTIWVDQPCINQDDSVEKSDQVSMMKYIYASAQQVEIHLGETSNDSDLVMDYMRNFDLLGKTGLPDDMSEHIPALRSVASLRLRPWWRRVWIIQEIAVAQVRVLHCGTKSILWEDFSYSCYLLSRHVIPKVRRSGRLQLMDICDGFIQNVQELNEFLAQPGKHKLYLDATPLARHDDERKPRAPNEDFWAHLSRSWRFQARDPRDRVYALLGLTETWWRSSFQISYQEDLPALYRRVVCNFLLQDPTLDILRLCDYEHHRSLPSWVPDWRYKVQLPLSGPSDGRSYRASGRLSASFRFIGMDMLEC